MKDEATAELVFTPDGIVKNVVFIDELVATAPAIPHWEFTALKPAISIDKLYLEMQGYDFNQDKLSFYAIEYPDYPDLIDIVVVHEDYNLRWDSKASHPWLVTLKLGYNGKADNGMPNEESYQLLNEIEDEVLAELKDEDGYLNIGRETADAVREIYFACVDFRKPSKVLYSLQLKYQYQIQVDYTIYKDKYWQAQNKYGIK